MEGHNVDDNLRKDRTSKRKQIMERKKMVDGLIKAASSLNDPLHSFPHFRNYNHLEAGQGAKLSRSLKQYVQKLLKQNMERHYGMEWAAEEKVKYREIAASEARYIFVREVLTLRGCNYENSRDEDKGNVVGFVHYRFTLEEELPVLYVYELQLEPSVQGKGLGKFLMQLMELIAQKSCMAAIMLTVQKRNLPAMLFYTNKLGYSISATSPSRVDLRIAGELNYEILCKAFDQEAKQKL